MQRLEVTLPGVTSSVPPARHFAMRTVEAWGLDDLGWSVALVVTELAANAVLHARTDFTVALVRRPDAVRVEVSDGAAARPRRRAHGTTATTGRGLHLLGSLAAEWGTEPAPGGKTVWCELPLAAPVVTPVPAAEPGAVA